MSSVDVFVANRVILTHFDSYSTALVFARFGNTLLTPSALPDGATLLDQSPALELAPYAGPAVTAAVFDRFDFKPDDLYRDDRYDAWARAGDSVFRIHLFRARTFSPPLAQIENHGGTFHPISELRTAPKVELGLIRGVFNLIMGGEQRHG